MGRQADFLIKIRKPLRDQGLFYASFSLRSACNTKAPKNSLTIFFLSVESVFTPAPPTITPKPITPSPAPTPDLPGSVDPVPDGSSSGGLDNSAVSGNVDLGPEWLSYVPILGSARDAYRDFQNGNYGWAIFNSAMAVSDVFLVKSLVVAGGKFLTKTAFKTGSHSWKNTRRWLGRTGFANPGQHVHHIYLHRNQGIGKYFSNAIKNQPWNLKAINGFGGFSSARVHGAIHGKSTLLNFNLAQRAYYGGYLRGLPYLNYGINSVENVAR